MTIYQKLLALQKEVGAIPKDSLNPFFKSKYFDINKLIEIIKPLLNTHGLIIVQTLSAINERPALKTALIDAETGEKIEDTTIITSIEDAQKMGAAITYFRRYAVQSMLFLQAEDDDANSASGKEVKKFPTYIKKADRDPVRPVTDDTVPDTEDGSPFPS